VEPWLSTAIAAFAAQALFLFAEIEDAYFDYGWSDGDMVGNLLGSALAAALDLIPWLDDLLDFRMWYRPTPYLYRHQFNVAEDYSGQKYFLVLKGGGVPWVKDTALRYLEVYVGYHAEGYRRYREVKERHVFAGFSLDVGRAVADLLWPPLDPPEFVRSWTGFVFEHWQPHFLHAPVYDRVLR
jgi:hypothetical protein